MIDLPSSNTVLVSVLGIAAARMNTLLRLRGTSVVQPQGSDLAAGGDTNCSATAAVAQPLRASSERFHKNQWPRRFSAADRT